MVLNHIETYTPSPLNMNCTIHEEDEECTTHEHATLLTKVPDYLSDEWTNYFQTDPIQEARESCLGTYYIFEEVPLFQIWWKHKKILIDCGTYSLKA